MVVPDKAHKQGGRCTSLILLNILETVRFCPAYKASIKKVRLKVMR